MATYISHVRSLLIIDNIYLAALLGSGVGGVDTSDLGCALV